MPWIYLVIAGCFEVIWATFLKLSNGFTNLKYSICTIVGMILSFYFLAQATKTLPIGTAYAVWTGIGALGAVIVGIFFFRESLTLIRGVSLILLLIGILGLKFSVSA